MKNLFVTTILLCIGSIVIAQGNKRSTYRDRKFLVSIGGVGGLPVGNNAKSFAYDLGGDLQAEYKSSEELGFTLNTSYLSYVKKNVKVNGVTSYLGTVGFFTGMGGVKYTFPNDYYIRGELGLAKSQSGSGTHVCYGPAVGYDFSRNIDLELKFFSISKVGDLGGSLSTINIRLGYNF